MKQCFGLFLKFDNLVFTSILIKKRTGSGYFEHSSTLICSTLFCPNLLENIQGIENTSYQLNLFTNDNRSFIPHKIYSCYIEILKAIPFSNTFKSAKYSKVYYRIVLYKNPRDTNFIIIFSNLNFFVLNFFFFSLKFSFK